MENKKPVFGIKDGHFVRVGFEGDPEFADTYWASRGECVKGNHIVLMVGIQKQIHCPVCEPDWDWKNDWRDIWNKPSESCPESHEQQPLIGA